jgi:prevent-host-death family protein
MSMVIKTIGAGEFKQKCLALIDEVAQTKTEILVTKRGRPLARLVPLESSEETEAALLTSLRGKGRMLVPEEEFLAPTLEDAGWNLGE